MSDWMTLMGDVFAEAGIPGGVLGILDRDRIRVFPTGVLSVVTGEPAAADSMFQAGSISKTWTAALVLQLVDEGRLTLEDRVVDVLPEAPLDERITLRHLLTHTSGVDGDLFDDTGTGEDALPRYVQLLAGAQQLFSPGAAYSYSNAGFSVLGLLVARLDGCTWEESLRRRLIEPLQLANTITVATPPSRGSYAVGHAGAPPEPVSPWQLPRSIGPAGLVTLSAADLLTYARAEVRAHPGALELQRPIPLAVDGCAGVGLTWRRFELGGTVLVGHDGQTMGQNAFLRMTPDGDFGLCLFTNLDVVTAAARTVMDAVLGDYLGVRLPDRPQPVDVPVDPAVLGVYERAGLRYDLVQQGQDLVLQVQATGARLEIAEHPYEEYQVRTIGPRSFVCRSSPDQPWQPFVIEQFDASHRFLFSGGRVTPARMEP